MAAVDGNKHRCLHPKGWNNLPTPAYLGEPPAKANAKWRAHLRRVKNLRPMPVGSNRSGEAV